MPTTSPAPIAPVYKHTTGKDRATVDALWRDFRNAIDATYRDHKAAGYKHDDERRVLHDYVRNMSMRDAIDQLEAAEIAGEREHRAFGRRLVGDIGRRIPHAQAARVVLLGHVANGAQRTAMPSAIEWLQGRRTCTEAQLLGYLVRHHLSLDWIKAADVLDYADAVK
jgi:hypothetical protein